MMERWFVMRKGAPFEEIAQKFGIHPVIARLIRNRNIVGDEAIGQYLNGTIADLNDGLLLKDMSNAVDILIDKIRAESKIRIIGDYDIDGINATYILLEGLRKLGADVDTDIPDRVKDGYGLNRHLVEKAWENGVDVILTCDNGIAAEDAIRYAREHRMTVIVTDHHEVPPALPDANAIVNPKQKDCTYPYKELCGAAVAYKLIETLFEIMGKDVEDVDYLMENVAIATVGDVMPLTGENRIFVKQGLEMLRRTNNPGLEALMAVNDIPKEQVSVYHIGYVLGPCMNATGRLDTAKKALSLLCAGTRQEAFALANELKEMNDHRKEMTVAAVEKAMAQAEGAGCREDKVLVIFLPDCHESLAGIVAGRVREQCHKPVFVLTRATGGVKGSGRSIEGYDMYRALCECEMLLGNFGGHKMAAGLSLEEKNVEPLRCMLNQKCQLTEEDLIPKVSIDMQLPFGMMDENLVSQFELLEPFGRENAKPVFAEKEVEILSGRRVGSRQNVLRMQLMDSGGTRVDAVYFGDVQDFLDFLSEKYGENAVNRMLGGGRTGMKASFTYCPSINEYMGRKSIQIVISGYQ